MTQQTALEFLKDRLESILELYNSEWDKVYQAFEQAKQMEADQSKANCDVARMQGWSKGYDEGHDEGFSKGYEEAMYDSINK